MASVLLDKARANGNRGAQPPTSWKLRWVSSLQEFVNSFCNFLRFTTALRSSHKGSLGRPVRLPLPPAGALVGRFSGILRAAVCIAAAGCKPPLLERRLCAANSRNFTE